MLRSFKEQLKMKAVDPQDPFRKYLRKRVGKKATLLLERKLKQFILMMPGVIARMYELWSQPQASSQVKKLGGFLLTYMYHPKDFLPEQDYGLFGYIDDAYFAALIYEEAVRDLQSGGGSLSAQDAELIDQIRKMKRPVKSVILRESEKIEMMVREVLKKNVDTYFEMFS